MEILGLKKANCKSCHKCIRECPVKSIEFSGQQARIIGDECILCGRCVVSCPQNAKEVRIDLPRVKAAMAAGRRVVASVAPSFIVDFSVEGIEEMSTLLGSLGFAATEETAVGAHIVKKEYERIIREGSQDILISTCCPSVVSLVQKYFPGLVGCLAPVVSPMEAHARHIKARDKDAFVVFIGPCISKKGEAQQDDSMVDCVLTFEEVRQWLEDAEVEPAAVSCDKSERRSRFFPKTGGIIQSMDRMGTGYRYYAVDGPQKCIAALKDVEGGGLHHCFIEMSICEGSCIGGPMVRSFRGGMLECHNKVTDYAAPGYPDHMENKDFEPTELVLELARAIPALPVRENNPGEAQIRAILEKTGKFSPEQELNCGCCGYPTCREKAKAVYNGKAEITMCLPYMMERAESFSDKVISSTPTAILVLDEDLIVQQINGAACKLLRLERPDQLLKKPVSDIMDPTDFLFVLDDGRSIRDKTIWLEGPRRFAEETIVYDIESKLLILLMKDVTKQQREAEKSQELKRQTVEVTDRIIEKQMRIVQEIASLLGETTAETKIALTKLKQTVYMEDKTHE
ncbi:MAG: [Fe-Fe] hydrogenase large subunit C-terminal domain-containing protein [Angelakisella sp.]|nr:[Fe-Fe] hydrogenase large subunit C-terminal domain-containing protein [Angelakisella sp.]